MSAAEQVYEEAKQLPEALAREALDFIRFLRSHYPSGEWKNLQDAQAVAMASVWDNDEDNVWDHV